MSAHRTRIARQIERLRPGPHVRRYAEAQARERSGGCFPECIGFEDASGEVVSLDAQRLQQLNRDEYRCHEHPAKSRCKKLQYNVQRLQYR